MYWNLRDEERFIEAIILADNPQLLENFLKDILTEKELQTCSARLKVLCLLRDGVPYRQIQSLTKVGSATIARLSKTALNKESSFNKIIKKFLKKGPSYFE